MQQNFGRPTGSLQQSQLFVGQVSTVTADFTRATFDIPPTSKMIFILCVGGGGGGSNGTANVNTGAGGGSGSMSTFYGPTYCLPGTLYLRIGAGGKGSQTGSTTTRKGGVSSVLLNPTASVEHTLIYANGGNAPAAGSGTGGTAGAAATIANMAAATLGQWTAIIGQAGTNAGANDVTFGSTGIVVTGGTGAGSGGSNAGSILHPTGSPFPTRAGNNTGTSVAPDGLDFIDSLRNGPGMAFFSDGGIGCGGGTTTRGGNGGLDQGWRAQLVLPKCIPRVMVAQVLFIFAVRIKYICNRVLDVLHLTLNGLNYS